LTQGLLELAAPTATRRAATERIDDWLGSVRPPTPCVVVDLDIVRSQHRALAEALPFAQIFYAVKANPAPAVITALAALGVSFDLASSGEIDRCADLGIPAHRFSFGNIVKREADVARAHSLGVGLFAFDSEGELEKLARAAPGATVFCRLEVSDTGAEWPLTHKFGCHPDMAERLLINAKQWGLKPVGVSFHVGSQQTRPEAWHRAIDVAARVFEKCRSAGLDLDLINLGGGLPAHYCDLVPPLCDYADVIAGALERNFGASRPRIIIEPGRYLVGDAGLLRASVLLVAKKSYRAKRRWVYLDAGRYNGLPETLGERIHYRLRTPRDGAATGPVALAGPTCDSTDIIYDRTSRELPLDLAIGDPIDFLSAGAYTASYASVEFNGFSPIRTYCI